MIEETKNIICIEFKNLSLTNSVSLAEAIVVLEVYSTIFVSVSLKSIRISFTCSDGKILVIIKNEIPKLNDLPT